MSDEIPPEVISVLKEWLDDVYLDNDETDKKYKIVRDWVVVNQDKPDDFL